jgi:hypothetical protein
MQTKKESGKAYQRFATLFEIRMIQWQGGHL